MPISPENAARYPKNWKDIRNSILLRAKNCCEECGIENGAFGYREDGLFVRCDTRHFMFTPPRAKCFRIVLTIAHLDHTPENCAEENLRAWCQRCHLAYDAKHHGQSSYRTRRKHKAIAELFE